MGTDSVWQWLIKGRKMVVVKEETTQIVSAVSDENMADGHADVLDETITCGASEKGTYEVVKRTFDFILSLVVSIALFVPILFVALLIICKDPGNPFYFQTRLGKGGKRIKIMKFRTMRKGAENLEKTLTPDQIEEYKREYKLDDDPRLIGWEKPGDGKTCFGALLRRTSIDEVMQIPYNILLKGNMSFVGPRPILACELQQNYTPEQQKVFLSVKPGLTGYWQAYARNEATYGRGGVRQHMELFYITHRSLWLDLKIMAKTVGTVLMREGAK